MTVINNFKVIFNSTSIQTTRSEQRLLRNGMPITDRCKVLIPPLFSLCNTSHNKKNIKSTNNKIIFLGFLARASHGVPTPPMGGLPFFLFSINFDVIYNTLVNWVEDVFTIEHSNICKTLGKIPIFEIEIKYIKFTQNSIKHNVIAYNDFFNLPVTQNANIPTHTKNSITTHKKKNVIIQDEPEFRTKKKYNERSNKNHLSQYRKKITKKSI